MIEALESSERARLRQFLIGRFGLSDLKDLAFDLGVDFQLFSHQTKQDFARELITYFEQKLDLSSLVMEVMKRRPSTEMADLLAKYSQRKIIVIIVGSEVVLESLSSFLVELASKLQVPEDEVVIVAAARGSMRLLVSVPEKAADLQVVSGIHNLGEKYQVSITLFDSLDSTSRNAWRLVARDHLPIHEGDVLSPTVIWQDALKEAIREAPSLTRDTPSERLQWRSKLTKFFTNTALAGILAFATFLLTTMEYKREIDAARADNIVSATAIAGLGQQLDIQGQQLDIQKQLLKALGAIATIQAREIESEPSATLASQQIARLESTVEALEQANYAIEATATANAQLISATPAPDPYNCNFIDELVEKGEINKILMGANGIAGVQITLNEAVDVPIGWTVHNQGKTYNAPVYFAERTFASFWGPPQCEPLPIEVQVTP